VYTARESVPAVRFTSEQFVRMLDDLLAFASTKEDPADECRFRFTLGADEAISIRGTTADIGFDLRDVREFTVEIPALGSHSIDIHTAGILGIVADIRSTDRDWLRRAKDTIRHTLRAQQPRWGWLRRPVVQGISVGLVVATVVGLFSSVVLSSTKSTHNGAAVYLVPCIALLLALPGLAVGSFRRFRIVEGSDTRARWLSIGKWFGTLLAGAALSWVVSQFFISR
jgi:hypothetical protein